MELCLATVQKKRLFGEYKNRKPPLEIHYCVRIVSSFILKLLATAQELIMDKLLPRAFAMFIVFILILVFTICEFEL